MPDPAHRLLPPSGFDDLYGLELLDVGEEEATGRVRVGAQHLQPGGVVHGGVYAAMAEAVTSVATWLAVRDEGKVAMGLSNHSSFLRPIAEGTVYARARRRHRGRSTWVWEVDLTDDAGRLCAVSRVTVAVRAAQPR